MARASSSDREYFARVARQNRLLDDERPPGSLAEMFDRLEVIRRSLGELARPGADETGDGDLPGHLAFLAQSEGGRARWSEALLAPWPRSSESNASAGC